MSRRPYPKYKDSGIEWLGEVPTSWPVVRLRFKAVINPSQSDLNGVSRDTQVSFVPMEAVGKYGGLCLDQSKPLDEVSAGYTYFRDGDVVAAKITPCFENGKGSVAEGLQNGLGFGTTELHVLRPSQRLEQRFLFYLTISHAFRRIGTASMYGAGGQKRVSDDFVRNFRHPMPAIEEQSAIATFLDRETERIDSLIAKKQRQVELLQEKRAALISHAVTKGLDPTVSMKDSGIEWLGDMPEHWPTVRLGYFARVRNGSTPSRSRNEYWMGGVVPWLASATVNEDVIKEPSEWITEQARLESGLEIVPSGSVAIGLVGQGRTRGISALVGIDAAINQNMAAIIPGRLFVGRYLHYLLQHMYEPIRDGGRGANQPALNCEVIADIRVLLPPLNEQQTIAEYLDRASEGLSATSAEIERSIATLREYRTALISAVVTGKIDVHRKAA